MVDTEVNSTDFDSLSDLLARGPFADLTGAGISTDSGIPDYRGEGSPPRNPMSVNQFLSDENYRKRYWAGSHRGWLAFNQTRPNRGHVALARLESMGVVSGVITQNVDGLHIRAGSSRVVDVHGSMSSVTCQTCGQSFSRVGIERQLSALNPDIDHPDFVRMNPDGDAEVSDIESFRIPSCSICGGMLKPDVVYFGEFVPTGKFSAAKAIVAQSAGLMVLGSSLAVNTGIRLVEQARREQKPIIIVNRGATKADARATIRVEGGISEFLERIVSISV